MSIVCGLPFTIAIVFMCTSIMRALKIDSGDADICESTEWSTGTPTCSTRLTRRRATESSPTLSPAAVAGEALRRLHVLPLRRGVQDRGEPLGREVPLAAMHGVINACFFFLWIVFMIMSADSNTWAYLGWTFFAYQGVPAQSSAGASARRTTSMATWPRTSLRALHVPQRRLPDALPVRGEAERRRRLRQEEAPPTPGSEFGEKNSTEPATKTEKSRRARGVSRGSTPASSRNDAPKETAPRATPFGKNGRRRTRPTRTGRARKKETNRGSDSEKGASGTYYPARAPAKPCLLSARISRLLSDRRTSFDHARILLGAIHSVPPWSPSFLSHPGPESSAPGHLELLLLVRGSSRALRVAPGPDPRAPAIPAPLSRAGSASRRTRNRPPP